MTERLAYSDKEAAHALGLSVRSIVYLRRTGRLGFSRIGRRILIPATELQRLLRQGYCKATDRLDADGTIRPHKQQGHWRSPEALDAPQQPIPTIDCGGNHDG
jgi:excisionase family DNA binding protein